MGACWHCQRSHRLAREHHDLAQGERPAGWQYFSQRQNLVPGASIYAANPGVNGWFNPLAFATPANGSWGNLGRYITNGPGNYEIYSSLQKRFRIGERAASNIRAAEYNLFNHPQYATPSGNFSSSSFRIIMRTLNTGAVGSGAPRRIEFMLRAEF